MTLILQGKSIAERIYFSGSVNGVINLAKEDGSLVQKFTGVSQRKQFVEKFIATDASVFFTPK